MAPELTARDGKVVLAAAAAAAAGIGAVAFFFLPDVFTPWPIFLAALALAGIGGALAAFALGGGYALFPTVVFLLPVYRLVLLFLRHGIPPWPTRGWFLLIGDGFPWWAGGALAAAGYAGAVAHRFARISLCLASLRRGRVEDYRALQSGAEGNLTLSDYEAVNRLCLGPVLGSAVIFTLAGPARERILVLACAASFLILGLYLTGMTYARRMAVIWAAQGVETLPDTEDRWWVGHGRFLWFLLVLLPLLPGGFRPISLAAILAWLSGAPTRPATDLVELENKTRMGHLPNLVHVAPGFLGQVIMVAVLVLYGVFVIGAAAASLAVCLLFLRKVGRGLLRWLKAIGPFWRGLGRFLSALRKIFHGIVAVGTRVFRWPARGRPPGDSPERSRRAWPASRIRMLFARLVLWGRTRGLELKPSYTPGEIGRAMGEIVPGQEEDLAYLIEVYQRERYGELRATRSEQRLYRQAWERTIGGANPGPNEAGSESKGEGGGE